MTMSDFNPKPSDKLTASERKELDTSEFGIPQLREFPIHDAAHVLSLIHISEPTRH